MAEDGALLLAQIAADTSQFRRELDKITGNVRKKTKDMQSDFMRMNKGINSSLSMLGYGVSAAAIVGFAKSTIGSLGEIADTAERLHMSTDALQALRHEMKLAGVEAEALEVGIRKFDDAAATAAAGGSNSLTKLFKDNGLSLLDQNGQLRSSNDLLGDYARLVANAATHQEKVALATDAFGKAGYKLIPILERIATEGLPALIDEAKKAGLVVESGLTKAADNIGDRWETMIDKLKVKLQSLIVEGVSAVDKFLDNDAPEEIARRRRLLESYDQAKSKGESTFMLGPLTSDAAWEQERQRLADFDEKQRELNRGKGFKMLASPLPTGKPTNTSGLGSSSAQKDRLNSFEREIQQIKERTEVLKQEATAQAQVNPLVNDYGYTIEKASAVQELLNKATREHINVTPELRAQIEQLAESYAQATVDGKKLAESQDEVRERAEDMRDMGREAFSSFISDLRAGKSGADALASALSRVADKLIDMSIDKLFSSKGGIFGSGGFDLGSLFGFGSSSGAPMNILPRAGGGPVTSGRPYLVGEKRPELFVPGGNGTIIPDLTGLSTPAGRSGSTVNNVSVTVNMDGGTSSNSDSKEAGDLGKYIAGVVKSAITNEQRPGGQLRRR